MFWKKKRAAQKLLLGLDVKRCAECEQVLRPCEVDGKPCLFHRFVNEDRALLHINAFCTPSEQQRLYQGFKEDGLVPKCCSTEVLRTTFALVEYPDGSLGKVDPVKVCFTDKGC